MADPHHQPSLKAIASKVAIPRNETAWSSRGVRSRPPPRYIDRTPNACTNCRIHKTRCDGGQPQCRRCQETGQLCAYQPSRRNRLLTATKHNLIMIKFLNNLKSSVAQGERQQIEDLLEHVTDDVTDAASNLDWKEPHNPDERRGEEEVSAEVGSNGEAEMVDEDILRDETAQANGYVGKSSVVQWLRHLKMEVDASEKGSSTPEGPYGPPGQDEAAASQRMAALDHRKRAREEHLPTISDSTFYLDCNKLSVDYDINPYDLPPISVARRLIDTYTHTVQTTFPILSTATLENEFRSCYTLSMQEKLFLMPGKRLALVNLVFAIGAKHLDLMQTGLGSPGRGHHTYYSRATLLGLDELSLGCDPDFTQVQTSALLALYLTSVGRVNRAWVVLGTSLRCAYALGLHVRNEDPDITIEEHELRSRMWWALHNMEENQSMIVGRPVLLSDTFCSTTLPLPLSVEQLSDETVTSQIDTSYKAASVRQIASRAKSTASEPPNSGSYLMALTRVSRIAQEAMVELYSPGAMEQSAKQMQRKTKGLCDQLEEWSASLPSGFRFTPVPADGRFRRERFILEMHHSRVKILVTRPCLCRLDQRIPNQTESSNNFNNAAANACVIAAKAVANILPDCIDITRLYSDGPWWCIVHHLMEAILVLIMGISHEFVQVPRDKDTLLQLQKLFRWLRALTDRNGVAERSYSTATSLLQRVGRRVKVDLSDILREDTASNVVPPALSMEPPLTASGTMPQNLASAHASERPWTEQLSGPQLNYGFMTELQMQQFHGYWPPPIVPVTSQPDMWYHSPAMTTMAERDSVMAGNDLLNTGFNPVDM